MKKQRESGYLRGELRAVDLDTEKFRVKMDSGRDVTIDFDDIEEDVPFFSGSLDGPVLGERIMVHGELAKDSLGEVVGMAFATSVYPERKKPSPEEVAAFRKQLRASAIE